MSHLNLSYFTVEFGIRQNILWVDLHSTCLLEKYIKQHGNLSNISDDYKTANSMFANGNHCAA